MSTQQKNKGGRKGGKIYPRHSLEMLDSHIELISSKASKTPYDRKSFCAGIFNLKHNNECKVRISSLKQFGLIEEKENKLTATDLCVRIAARSSTERSHFYEEAFRNVPLFKMAYETFSGTTVTAAQIATYAADTLGVHFDNRENFAIKLVESAKKAGLCKDDNDGYFFELVTLESIEAIPDATKEEEQDKKPPPKKLTVDTNRTVNIEVKIDSTLDPETLEKHLKKLKKFGLI